MTEENKLEEINIESTESIEPWKTAFYTEEINETETKKQRLERLYNQMAIENWFESIEHFYVSMKFKLAMRKEGMDKADDYMEKLLRGIASDLWYGSWNKEFVMQNTLPQLSWDKAVMR